MSINYHDVADASQRLRGKTKLTPVLQSKVLSQIAGYNIFSKAECLQHTGSFKYRGAYNRLSAMSADERANGVVAFSSGNHAQGVARAAKELGIDAIIVMPSDAPKVKVDGVLADGARIHSYDRMTESREKIAADISARDGRIVVPSFDDLYIIAGQGTAGIELAKQCEEMHITLDALIICLGGGGLCAGISTAFKHLSPHTKIFGAEPADYNDHQMSLSYGNRVTLISPPPTLCDALMTPQPGALTWPINSKNLSGVCTVTDEECLMTMKLAKQRLGVTLEPGGSVALTAALSGRFNSFGDFANVGVILSGGNVDPDVMARAMAM
ncbi:threonine ammonia-lyase [Robiginitomaculum antarcticum]|uniref:threonine ammonia-lyase n=1 Tax=Robiginitomaculum antarcticum TaxID=437507 RepID=UPI0004757EA5|nr:threonine/serine dehydratase [Robiginitomaculum antarcticum]